MGFSLCDAVDGVEDVFCDGACCELECGQFFLGGWCGLASAALLPART